MPMDPQIKALAALKRELHKIVGSVDNQDDKLMLIDFAERELDKIRQMVDAPNYAPQTEDAHAGK